MFPKREFPTLKEAVIAARIRVRADRSRGAITPRWIKRLAKAGD